MVEKTKRALSILQERNAADGEGTVDGLNLNGFSNEQNSLNFLNRRTAEDVKRTANELMAHTVRLTEERVAFVRRKAGRWNYNYCTLKFQSRFGDEINNVRNCSKSQILE